MRGWGEKEEKEEGGRKGVEGVKEEAKGAGEEGGIEEERW